MQYQVSLLARAALWSRHPVVGAPGDALYVVGGTADRDDDGSKVLVAELSL